MFQSPLMLGIDVIGACWDAVFKHAKSVLFPKIWKSHRRGRKLLLFGAGPLPSQLGRFLEYVHPAGQHGIWVPPSSEDLEWDLVLGPSPNPH